MAGQPDPDGATLAAVRAYLERERVRGLTGTVNSPPEDRLLFIE